MIMVSRGVGRRLVRCIAFAALGLTTLSVAQVDRAEALLKKTCGRADSEAALKLLESGDLPAKLYILENWFPGFENIEEYTRYFEVFEGFGDRVARAVDRVSRIDDARIRKAALRVLARKEGYIDSFSSVPLADCGIRSVEPEFTFSKTLARLVEENPDMAASLLDDKDGRVFYGIADSLKSDRHDDVFAACAARLKNSDIRQSRAALIVLTSMILSKDEWLRLTPNLRDSSPGTYSWIATSIEGQVKVWAKQPFDSLPPLARVAVVRSGDFRIEDALAAVQRDRDWGLAHAILTMSDLNESDWLAVAQILATGAAEFSRLHPSKWAFEFNLFPFDVLFKKFGEDRTIEFLDRAPAEIQAYSLQSLSRTIDRSRLTRRYWRSLESLQCQAWPFVADDDVDWQATLPILLAMSTSTNSFVRQGAMLGFYYFGVKKGRVSEKNFATMLVQMASTADERAKLQALDLAQDVPSGEEVYAKLMPMLSHKLRLERIWSLQFADFSGASAVLRKYVSSPIQQESEVALEALRKKSVKDGS